MPESCLTCTRGTTPSSSATAPRSSRDASRQIAISARAPRAWPISSPATEPMTRIGASPTSGRSVAASPAVATASIVAPPLSAALALSAMPWPYAFAFTTAHIAAPGSSIPVRCATFRSIAPRSMRATARFTGEAPRGARRSRRLRSRTRPRPTCSAAATPAFVFAQTPAQAASNGSRPLGKERADRARKDVAGAGGR